MHFYIPIDFLLGIILRRIFRHTNDVSGMFLQIPKTLRLDPKQRDKKLAKMAWMTERSKLKKTATKLETELDKEKEKTKELETLLE